VLGHRLVAISLGLLCLDAAGMVTPALTADYDHSPSFGPATAT
jgi:hypothetical protein